MVALDRHLKTQRQQQQRGMRLDSEAPGQVHLSQLDVDL
jgi:hypothetical protein